MRLPEAAPRGRDALPTKPLLRWVLLGLVLCLGASGLPSARAGSYPAGLGSQLFLYAEGTVDLKDGTEIGSEDLSGGGTAIAGVYGGRLRLADRATRQMVGSFKLPDLDPGSVMRTCDVKFGVVMTAAQDGRAGEGWSLNFGPLPADDGTGESGFAPLRGGLTIAFDTFDNGGDAPSISVLVGGVPVANFPQTYAFDSVERTVVMHWDGDGLDLNYANRGICTNLALPGFSPGPGHRFGFTARTSEVAMDVSLGSMRVTTQALPSIETGGPVISEFMANNAEFEDEFADKPGWIELLNGTGTTLDLAGWYLTDSKSNLAKWRIQNLVLTPYNYRVVFASGRDRQLSAVGFPHANFTLARGGGFVALVRPDGKTIESSYEYGPQSRNVSYGEQGAERRKGFMAPASPGTVNTSIPEPGTVVPEVVFSHPGGMITDPVSLELSSPAAPGAEIRYTTNRTEPGRGSLLYSQPIAVNGLMTVRARAYLPARLPGVPSSRTFVRLDSTLTNFAGSGKVFDSNLPLLFLEAFGSSVDSSGGGSSPFRPCYALVIPPETGTGRARLTSPPEYAGPAGAHVRGESSAGFDQKSYALELWDEASRDTDAGLLGMPSDSDWVLYGPWSEKTFMRNKLVFDWMQGLRGEDGTAVRTRFVELFFNQTRTANGQVGYSAYRGVYVLMEKLKRGQDRVRIANLNSNTYDPELITGGYIIRRDKVDNLKNSWTSRSGIPMQSFDPDRLNTNQLTYIRNYFNAFEAALSGTSYRNPTNGWRAYIDPDTFIDAQWMLEIAKQVDGYVFSTYWHKDRGGRLRAGPLWDFNISLGNADYATGDLATGWLYDSQNGVGQNHYPRLHSDPEYKLAHWDRYWHIRRTILATDTVMAQIDRFQTNLLDNSTVPVTNRMPDSVQNPVARHFRRWQRLGLRDWPNPAASTRLRTWQSEVDYLKTWLRTRLEWLDDQSLRNGKTVYRPPMLSHTGGRISAPIDLVLAPYQRVPPTNSYPEGTIYYTVDGTDPRLPGGTISSAATAYTAPLRIDAPTKLLARLYTAGTWTPLAVATYLLDAVPAKAGNLVVSEIQFRPAPPTLAEGAAGIVDAGSFEFVELRNIGPLPIDLAGVRLTSGVDFAFDFAPSTSRLLRSGESAVLVSDPRAFALRYPQVPAGKVFGQFRGHLDSGGETLTVRAADGSVIVDFRYDDDAPWPVDGLAAGRSLVLKEPATNPRPGLATSWLASAREGGTPGESGIGSAIFAGDPARDTDGDGLTDLFEFGTGSDAEDPASGFQPWAALARYTVGGVDDVYFRFEYRRRPKVGGATVVLEASRDLRVWESPDSWLLLAETKEYPDGTRTEVYRSRSPVRSATGAAGYLRVRVASP